MPVPLVIKMTNIDFTAGLGRAIALSYSSAILDSIKTVSPLLHRIRVSGNYNYEEIINRIGLIKLDPSLNFRNERYRDAGFVKMENVVLSLFINRIKAAPPMMIEFSCPPSGYVRWLQRLEGKIPNLKISSIEYAIDFIMSNPESVRDLFCLMWKYLVPKYQRDSAKMRGLPGRLSWGDHYSIGHYNNFNRQTGHLKFYERGPDEKKIKKAGKWSYMDTDRVRLEFTAKRKTHHLADKGLDTLHDLICSARFSQMFARRICFKRAKRNSKRLPQEYAAYMSPDPAGNMGSFFLEHRAALKNYPHANIYREEEAAPQFDGLLRAIMLMADWYDRNWSTPCSPPDLSYLLPGTWDSYSIRPNPTETDRINHGK